MPHRNSTKLYGEDKCILLNKISEFIKNQEYTFTSNDVARYVNSALNSSYSSTIIRKLMKDELNLSYKKIKSRPNNVDFSKIRSARILFAIKFAKFINKNTLILNLDESSINRSIKNDYSWSLKGISKEAKNAPFVGSAWIISCILSNGNWISLITNNTVNSIKFVVFLENLKQWLRNNNNFNYSDVLLLLDNWSIHKSRESIKKLKKINAKILYLPPYSPNFAPVEEFFGIMKMKIKKQWIEEVVKLNTKANYDKIVKSLKAIKSISIRKMFKNLYSQIKTYIN